MRTLLPPEVEARRVGGDPGSGPCGAFRLFCPVLCRTLTVVVSDGRLWDTPLTRPTDEDLAELPPKLRAIALSKFAGRDSFVLSGPPWEHASVSASTVPTWAEMCWVKGVFWEPHEVVVQYHPAESEYVNDHPRTLHLWRPLGTEIPTPPKECV